jgi:glutathione S-transferase
MSFLRARAISGLSLACAAGAAATYYSSAGIQPVHSDSKKTKLVYFDIPGRAFAIRAALRHANVPFEDGRISYPQLVQGRGPTGANMKFPLGQVPTLELPSGLVVCQSVPILRWAARQSDLYPKNIDQALLCDEIVETVSEMRSKLPDAKDENERKKLREDYIQNVVPKYMDQLTSRLEQSGGPFFLGKSLTMADLVVARTISSIVDNKFDHINKESVAKWPVILKHYEATCNHPVYKNEIRAEDEYQKSKPK